MRADTLTDRQRQVLEWIRAHVRRWGVPPSRSEIARTFGLAFPSAADTDLKALARKG